MRRNVWNSRRIFCVLCGIIAKLFMGKRELERFGAMERVKAGEMTLVEAAVRLGVSYRQGKRIYKRYREKGAAGLPHGNQGRVSNNRIGGAKGRAIPTAAAARGENALGSWYSTTAAPTSGSKTAAPPAA
jgi:hypothetical protein